MNRFARLVAATSAAIAAALILVLPVFAQAEPGASFALSDFLNSAQGIAVQGLLVVAFADWATGTMAAVKDGTFSMEAIGAWIRKHVAGRVGPIGLLLFLSYYGGAAGLFFAAGAATLASTYIAETVASIFGNLNPPKAADVKDTSAAAKLNPVPQD